MDRAHSDSMQDRPTVQSLKIVKQSLYVQNDMDVSGLDRAHLEESLHDAEQRFINSGQNIQKLDQQIKVFTSNLASEAT